MLVHDDMEEPVRPRDDDEAPELELDDLDDVSGDLSGRSYDELADSARAALEREHDADKAELEPDDAAAAVIETEARPWPDADERPV